MKITGWHIDGYGVHHDHGAEALPAGLTIVTGPNEAGKSTLQDFVIGMLFGFSASNRADHHAPLRGGAYGGRLFVTDEAGTPFTIHRGSQKRSLKVTGPDGTRSGADAQAELTRLLGGATKELYLALFAVHTDELDELKALTDAQVRDRVFSAGVLGAGRTARAALDQLSTERDELWKPGGRSADKYALRRLREQLTDARAQLADARRDATGLPALQHRIATVEADRERAKAERSDQQERRSLLFVVSNQWPTWAEAAEARGELDQLGVVEPVPAGARPALEQLVERRNDLRDEAASCEQALHQAEAGAAALDAPGPALAHATAIAELATTLAVEQERNATIDRLSAELHTAERELAVALAAIGPSATEAWLEAHPADPTASSELRARSAEVQAAAQRTAAVQDAAERAAAAHQHDETALAAREAALAERPDHPVDRARRAVEDAATLATLLSQRDTVAHRIASAGQPTAPPAPALPPHLATALVAAAVVALAVGIGAAATGAPVIGAGVAVLAIALAGIAAAARRAATPAAEAPAAPPVDLHRQLDELDAAIAPLLATFGLAARPTLAEATNLRVRAEQLANEATELHRERADAAERRTALHARHAHLTQQAAADAAAAQSALTEARTRWATWLADQHLPATLDAAGAGELLDAISRARTLHATVQTQRATLAEARAARTTHTQRVIDLARTTGLADKADAATRPLAVIAEMETARRRAEAAQQAIATQAVAVDAARTQHERARTRAEQAARSLDELLGQIGATTVAEAHERIDRAERAATLRRTITQADRDLRTSIGPDDARLDHARALLTRADPVRWTTELDEYDAHLKAIDARIEDLTTEHAHLCLERDHLERSADVATAELHVADLEAQLVDAITRWATLTTAHQLVDATLARYQRERQPGVVTRAAAHFAQVTDGRYRRLEVREQEIVAIDASEREVRADQLSKGTMQQLYLSMRFALAESYAQTTPLPLLLDDIAVHADDGRHPRLADVIATVAAQHQVFAFTGHERTLAQLRAASPAAHVIELQPSTTARRIGLAAG